MLKLLKVCGAIAAVGILSSCASLGDAVPNLIATASDGESGQSAKTAQWFAENRNSPPRLRAFLTKMPKGGDIHTHLSGAVYAESYLQWASDEKLCVTPESGAISGDNHEPCQVKPEIPVAMAMQDSELYGNLVDKMSLRNFEHAEQSGHDQFFEAFGKFAGGSKGQMIAELSNRAARQNIAYLEMMLTVGKKYSKQFSQQVRFTGNIDAAYNQIMAAGLKATIPAGQQELQGIEQQAKSVLACDSTNPQPGCAVERRYVLQINRTGEPSRVFAEMVYAFETAKADPLAAGVNMVAPEDNVVALRDYDLHMRMMGYLSARYPEVPVSLHAGELTLGLVPPEYLHDHIRQAVEIAGARRIGHGVDVMYEDNPFQLMKSMHDRGVLVEICLTSNDAILGVKGKQHPFPEYLKAGVPATLASDDEGISRIDLTHEYQRAAEDYGLSYPDLKTLARNSIHYAFLKGESLWANPSYGQLKPACHNADFAQVSASCQQFLEANDKAEAEWKLEKQFRVFENGAWL
jgi:adenosine deaminase/adenosine deaminase CECR1